MKKIAFIGLALSIPYFTFCQIISGKTYYNDKAKIIPAAPDAAAVEKYGGVDVLLNAGAISKAISFKPIIDREIVVPLDLNYTSNGIKANDCPSRAGMGWSLSIGGQITRTVRGMDDLAYARYVLPDNTAPNNEDLTVTTYCWNLFNQGGVPRDAEPDIFTYDIEKYSGKFIIDNQGNIIGIPATNLKISINTQYPLDNTWRFKIITPEGLSYFFGSPLATESSKMAASAMGGNFVPNTWRVTKIVHPTGYFTTFTYEQNLGSYIADKIEAQYKLSPDASTFVGPDPNNNGIIGDYSEDVAVAVQLSYLREITTSTNAKINFNYLTPSFPERMLQEIIYTNENGVTISKYNFEYSAASAVNPIPFLKGIRQVDASNVQMNDGHQFFYNNLTNFPVRNTFSQDHWGYFNGKLNSTLIPVPDDPTLAVLFPRATANREPDEIYAKTGLLSKIIYPTGGSDTIEYEANQVTELKDINGYNTASNSITSNSDLTYLQSDGDDLLVNYDGKISLVAKSENINNTQQIHAPDGKIIIKNLSNVTVLEISIPVKAEGTAYEPYAVNLPQGNYLIYAASKGLNIKTSFKITYRLGSTPNMQNVAVAVGGVRVKKITTNDIFNSPAQIKRLYYGTFSNLNFSSAYYAPKPVYYTVFNLITYYIPTGASCSGSDYTYQHRAMTNSSLRDLDIYDGKIVKYSSVIESMGGDNFENGAVEHKFHILPDRNSLLIRGAASNTPMTNDSYAELGEIETTIYAKKNAVLIKKITTQNTITVDPTRRFSLMTFFNIYAGGSIACAQFGTNGLISNPLPLYHKLYHINKYNITSAWKYLSQKTQQVFDDNGLNPVTTVTNYYYDNVQHMQLTRAETINSKQENITTSLKYPGDIAAIDDGNVYARMILKNMISPVVEERRLKNTTLELEMLKTNYVDLWPANTSMITVGSIDEKNLSNLSETRFQYYNYDLMGHPLELSKTNDIHVSFLWGYNKQFPIAEVKNANNQEVAYTSFEANATDSWAGIVPANIVSDVNSLTGKKQYTQTAFSISKTGLTATSSYIISYWTKNTTAYAVSGTQAGWPKQGKTVTINGQVWRYFEHLVTGVTTAIITGTGAIDELRLYPSKAQMTSYTYEPLVGITSACDVNNHTTYYEYDSFQRLLRIRDEDQNIIKQLDYKYQQ